MSSIAGSPGSDRFTQGVGKLDARVRVCVTAGHRQASIVTEPSRESVIRVQGPNTHEIPISLHLETQTPVTAGLHSFTPLTTDSAYSKMMSARSFVDIPSLKRVFTNHSH